MGARGAWRYRTTPPGVPRVWCGSAGAVRVYWEAAGGRCRGTPRAVSDFACRSGGEPAGGGGGRVVGDALGRNVRGDAVGGAVRRVRPRPRLMLPARAGQLRGSGSHGRFLATRGERGGPPDQVGVAPSKIRGGYLRVPPPVDDVRGRCPRGEASEEHPVRDDATPLPRRPSCVANRLALAPPPRAPRAGPRSRAHRRRRAAPPAHRGQQRRRGRRLQAAERQPGGGDAGAEVSESAGGVCVRHVPIAPQLQGRRRGHPCGPQRRRRLRTLRAPPARGPAGGETLC
mmetsp:Transcript_17674/g.42603  ORF Transcript_17674/g.42603 Transcript_17674/m.42603 type:complete len:286 (-) Transcript_17674:437-1294(-)